MKTSSVTYAPDDAKISVQWLDFLHAGGASGGANVLAAVMDLLCNAAEPTVAQIAGLRKGVPAEQLHAALTIAMVQIRAAKQGKFPEVPFLWSTPEALAQSTGTVVARWKARRFATLKPAGIVDLCSGIGGDTLALCRVARVSAVDLSAVRLRCLEFNVEQVPAAERFAVETRAADIRTILSSLPQDALFHMDPARRSAGRRSARFADLIPGPEVITEVIRHFPGGAIKLSPAVDFDSLPSTGPGHLELISHRGTVMQAVLWVGTLARLFPANTRTASVLEDRGADYSLTDFARQAVVPENLAAGDLRGTLCELDGAITRAGLAAAFCDGQGLVPLTQDGGYALGANAPTLPPSAAVLFQIEQVLPFSEKRVAAALAKLPAAAPPGPVEVKSRGRLPGIDTDRLQRLWSDAAACGRTVLLFQLQGDVLAMLAQRDCIDRLSHNTAIPPHPKKSPAFAAAALDTRAVS